MKVVRIYEIAYDMILDIQQEIIPVLRTETGAPDYRMVHALSAAYILQDYIAERIAAIGESPEGEERISWDQIKEALLLEDQSADWE